MLKCLIELLVIPFYYTAITRSAEVKGKYFSRTNRRNLSVLVPSLFEEYSNKGTFTTKPRAAPSRLFRHLPTYLPFPTLILAVVL